MAKFRFPAVAEDAKFTEFLKRRFYLSFLKFVLLRTVNYMVMFTWLVNK